MEGCLWSAFPWHSSEEGRTRSTPKPARWSNGKTFLGTGAKTLINSPLSCVDAASPITPGVLKKTGHVLWFFDLHKRDSFVFMALFPLFPTMPPVATNPLKKGTSNATFLCPPKPGQHAQGLLTNTCVFWSFPRSPAAGNIRRWHPGPVRKFLYWYHHHTPLFFLFPF